MRNDIPQNMVYVWMGCSYFWSGHLFGFHQPVCLDTQTEDRQNGINSTERCASFTYNPNALLPKLAWFLLQNPLHNFPPHYYLITPAIKFCWKGNLYLKSLKHNNPVIISPLVRSGGGTSLQRADSRARQSLGRGMYRLGTFGKWCAWATITASLNVVLNSWVMSIIVGYVASLVLVQLGYFQRLMIDYKL